MPPAMEQTVLQDLQMRLADLDHKVQAYRHDLAAEFQSYCYQALRKVDPAVALKIEQSLVSSLADYPALGPEFASKLTSRQSANEEDHQHQGQHQDSQSIHQNHVAVSPLSASTGINTLAESPINKSPADTEGPSPPPPGTVFGAAADLGFQLPGGESDPHEREKEFQGLFTPFFLPLLDSSPNLPTSPPPTLPSPQSQPSSAASLLLAEPVIVGNGSISSGIGSGIGVDAGSPANQVQGLPRYLQDQKMEGLGENGAVHGLTGTSSGITGALQAALSPLDRPHPARRGTGDTFSSAASDKSDSKTPRSALRRSSTGSKASNPSPRRVRFEFRGVEVLPTASPQPSDFPTPRPESPITSDDPRTFDEIANENGQGGPIDDEPPPRKISSSEALRALSRTPLEEGTVWTVVNSGQGDSDRNNSSPSISLMNSGTTASTQVPVPTAAPAPKVQLEANSDLIPQGQADDDSDDSSGDEFLAIGKPKSFQNKKTTILPTRVTRPITETSPAVTASSESPTKKEEDDKDQTSSEDFDDDEDMFHFESTGLSAPPRPKRRPPPLKEDVADSPETLTPIEDEPPFQPTSPAVPMPRRPGSSGPSTPTASRFQVGSLGSYKGRPVIMPVVKNPEIHAQAEELGEFNTFVGGLDGRSGVDEGDLSSFRASFVQTAFSGTPRSLTERMLMEDATEERRLQREQQEQGN